MIEEASTTLGPSAFTTVTVEESETTGTSEPAKSALVRKATALPTWSVVTVNVSSSSVPATGSPSTTHCVVTSSDVGSNAAGVPVSVSPGRTAPLVPPETCDGVVTFGPSGASVSATMTALWRSSVPTETSVFPSSRDGSMRSALLPSASLLHPSNSPSRVRY